MGRKRYTVSAAQIQKEAAALLQATLELADYKESLPAGKLAGLLLVAVWGVSLSGVCSLVKDAPSPETVRKALHANLPPRPTKLRERLLQALRELLPEHLRVSPHPAVIDFNQRPYYGKTTHGVTGRQKKASTKKSFTYATLAVLTPTGRFPLGLLLTRPYMRLTTILQELLAQVAEAGLSVSYLLLDKKFYAAEVIDLLQKKGVPFAMPAQKKGSKAGGGNRHLFAKGTTPGWYDYQWTTDLRKRDFKAKKRYKSGKLTVRVAMAVSYEPKKGENLVYACWGLKWPPATVRAVYRQRFGIETKYRQVGECLGKTCSRDERVRLLLLAVSLLLCALWALLHSEVFATGPLGERRLHLALLRLPVLLRALAQVLIDLFGGVVQDWPTQRPFPKLFATN